MARIMAEGTYLDTVDTQGNLERVNGFAVPCVWGLMWSSVVLPGNVFSVPTGCLDLCGVVNLNVCG